MKPSAVLGIDIGSVSVSIVTMGENRKIFDSATAFHHGDLETGLKKTLESVDLSKVAIISATSSTPHSIRRDLEIDDQVALIGAARHIHGKTGSILNVGGEKFSLSLFDENGNYSGSRSNTSCAAGTGSFLDQQARRLELETAEQLSLAATGNKDSIPEIATRCAVFAKTDLIHAQQQGFSIGQISEGLCQGLARNIFNTVFTMGDIRTPVVFCGGVSKNESVRSHLSALIHTPLVCDENSHLYGAIGAALAGLERADLIEKNNSPYSGVSDIFVKSTGTDHNTYPPLDLTLSNYPDFKGWHSSVANGVEIDIYVDPATMEIRQGFIGMDVGSTSTKAVLITERGDVLAGFYTRTASKPVNAVQKIIRAMDRFINDHGLSINILGCGTTGSGRKLSGSIINAELILDEITAHARAAHELNPKVDTIIEIGGQDAKFTTMKNGMVTSSFMNTVCAAGTGSFIEEQAAKLGCPLDQYSKRTRGVASPISSDRCTVFMERDMNHFLSEGYNVDQVLASALHSVRDNYLTKVASVAKIGSTVLFQGATAKNRALVAAFEQKLKKPIHVSRYCHLTGALGVALTLKDSMKAQSLNNQGQVNHTPADQNSMNRLTPINVKKFRGFDLWKTPIPVRQETCRLCMNHCKITIADINDETAAFGFLCGRDYKDDHYVAKKRHFHMIRSRKKAFEIPEIPTPDSGLTLGIPAGLHLVEDLEMWQLFFGLLNIKTVTSKGFRDDITLGRNVANAEFCTPMTAMHGHVAHLLTKADYIFLPFYFEDKDKAENEKTARRQYCYYTQFLPSVMANIAGMDRNRLVSPVIKYLYTSFHTKLELYKALKRISPKRISFFDISSAFDRALEWKKTAGTSLKKIYSLDGAKGSDIDVLLVGRPYTVLSDSLNAKIPDIFSSLKVNLFFQDMLDLDKVDISSIAPLLGEIHWKHAATVLRATLAAARTDNLYPVFVTSFKCSPDSFTVDYFKQIMEAHDKPYLVLELDEHDSSVGYETRIEAGIRAFRNHSLHGPRTGDIKLAPMNPDIMDKPGSKTLVVPNWDQITGTFLAATLRGEGIKAILMDETEATIKQSLATNTGQCIPLNAIASGYVKTIQNHGLDPADTLLWMSKSDIACNIKMYSHHIKTILNRAGNGMEKAGVFRGELSFMDIGIKAGINCYFAHMFAGLLTSIGCKMRPYEVVKGATDLAISKAVRTLTRAFEGGLTKEDALKEAMDLISRVELKKGMEKVQRPKVAIFGDFYVRDNSVMNQGLVRYIEANGGEVVTTPYYRFAKMIAHPYFKKWFNEGKYMNLISGGALLTTMKKMEKRYYRYFQPLLNEPEMEYTDSFEQVLDEYGVLPEHTGESMDNLLKIHYITKEHPDLALFVQTNPSYCCPGLVTEAMASAIEKKTGVPVLSLTYDALGGNKNQMIVPFLAYSKKAGCSQTFKKSV